jgi:hypothetical protein
MQQKLIQAVRPFLTVLCAVSVVVLTVTQALEPEFRKSLAASAVASWFAERATRKGSQ